MQKQNGPLLFVAGMFGVYSPFTSIHYEPEIHTIYLNML